MSDNAPSEFGLLVLKLRGNETQKAFAVRVNVERGTIGNVEKGIRAVSPGLRSGLIQEFPERKKEIEDAYNRSVKPRAPRSLHQDESLTQRQIQERIKSGRIHEAKQAVLLQLKDTSDDREQMWLYDQLARVCFAENKEVPGLDALTKAIEAGERVDIRDTKLITLRDELASRYQRRDEFEAAHPILDSGLLDNPTASLLWRRKGVVYYYEGDYCNAYAALTAALKYKQPLNRIIHIRGGVLAEWGNYDAALEDLDAILVDGNNYNFNPVQAALVRSIRAYVIAKRGDIKRAMREFSEAEKIIPGDAKLHYRRALCYLDNGETDIAIEGLTKALTVRGRRLNLPKRLDAERLLRDLKTPMPSAAKS